MLKRRCIAMLVCIVYITAITLGAIGCKNQEVKLTEPAENVNNENLSGDNDKNTKEDNEVKCEASQYKLSFKNEPARNTIDVPYQVPNFKALVKPYEVKADLSNVENLKQFGNFTKGQMELLSKNGFVVTPTNEEQLFYIYEYNQYNKIPSFITTDSVLQVYHVFYSYSLRKLESEKFLDSLDTLTKDMLDKSQYLYRQTENETVKKALIRNISYFTVAWMLLDKEIPTDIPQDALNLAKQEYELIEKKEGFKDSCIFPYELDYSQYEPRGHYTRSSELKKYFKAMMWYGQAPLPLYIEKDGQKKKSVDQTLQALLITYCMFLNDEETKDIELWENIYDITNFYVGSSDDLSIYDYKNLLIKAYGENPDINTLADKDKLDIVYKEAEKLPEPQIVPQFTGSTIPVGKQFRFMGQRYVPDSEIMQRLVNPTFRPIPSAIDVMGVLGCDRAYDIQININKENEKWEDYSKKFKETKKKFDEIKEDKWKSNMYYGWIWTLKGLFEEFSEGYPSFMTNTAWKDKSLTTAMSSWAELKHDTILYGKQSGAECGDGYDMTPKHYVEPNIDVYNRLLWLTKYSKENLKARNILTEDMKQKLEEFEELLEFLINCSIKELKNEELTEDENYKMLTYGGWLEYLTSSFAEGNCRWFEITSETDKNMACIADVHTVRFGHYLEVGVGPAYEIYVVVPIGGKLYLTRGAAFSYNEFLSDKRLTDEEWQKMLKENKKTEQNNLQWTKSFLNKDKKEVPKPKN